MFRPSGSIADDDGLEPQAREQRRRDGRRRAVRAVDRPSREPRTVSRERFRKHRAQVIEIRADEIRLRNGAGWPSAGAPRRIGDDRLDLALDPLGELLAAARKHLDAVVLERIVRSGNHDAGVVSGASA